MFTIMSSGENSRFKNFYIEFNKISRDFYKNMASKNQNNTHCPICSNKNLKPFYEHMNIYQCTSCGLIFNIGSDLLSEQYYTVEAGYENSIKNEQKLNSRKRNVRQRLGLLNKYLNQRQILLDIGCNEGLFLSEVKNKVKMVHGVEPNLAMTKYAQSCGLEIKSDTLENVEFPQEYFDIITIFHVLEHLKNPLNALYKIHSWLKPNGLLVIEVPNIESPMSKIKGENWSMIRQEHILYFSHMTLNKLLNKANFIIIERKTRDFDQYRTGIGKNLQKLGLVIKKRKEQENLILNKKFSEDNAPKKSLTFLKKIRRGIQIPIKYILGLLVQSFDRGDHLFVISVKTDNMDFQG